MARLDAQSATFEKIKHMIKEDNTRTGVQPQAARRRAGSEDSEPSVDEPRAHANGSQPPPTQPPLRTKPAVQPKPRALHGNAIAKQAVRKPVVASKTPQDLAARFANLRSASNSKDEKAINESLSLAHMIPTLPAVPAAIYSPARGTISSHAAELPTSNQRGMFSRSNSNTSFTKSPPPGGDIHFTQMPSYPPPNSATKRARSAVPAGDTVTLQELLDLMQTGSRDLHLLIIDVRNRDEFDDGHILSQATICIEPDILQRENISAAQIAESMVLAPASEVRLFERRHEFDLVIFYDQSSDTVPIRPGSPEANAILALYNALSLYDYDAVHDSEPRKPKLLKGGVDAWIDVVGPGSLQTSSTVGYFVSKTPKTATLRTPMTRMPGKRRISTIQDADEARSWENHVQSENSALVRTKEDFLRRFPSVSAMQESMTSPVESPRARAAVARGDYSTDFPSPPTRPAPTVPRHSHSGLPDDMETDHRARAMLSLARPPTMSQRKRTGLVNPSQWCYANSMLQAMFGSGAFAEEYITGSWSEAWKVPMKQGEKIQNPQLLSKILANLFHWMQNGTLECMKAKTLMEYVGHIHQKDSQGVLRPRSTCFGGSQQQDSQEFLLFVMDNLHDETNKKRDKDGRLLVANVTLPKHASAEKMVGKAKDHWAKYCLYNDSIIDKYWRSQTATRRICSCGYSSMTFATYETYVLSLPQESNRTTLHALLEKETAEELLEDYRCDGCKEKSTTMQKLEFGRLPDRLCFVLNRFSQTGTHISKNDMVVKFPTTDLDMKKFALPGSSGQDTQSQGEAGFRGSFVYDLYATIVQSGSLTGGHYRAYVQDDSSPVKSSEWTLYDDARLSPVQIGPSGSGDKTEDLYKDSNGATAYILFYQRRGTK